MMPTLITLLKNLDQWIKLDSQQTIHKAVMVYKSLNGLTPDLVPNLLTVVASSIGTLRYSTARL